MLKTRRLIHPVLQVHVTVDDWKRAESLLATGHDESLCCPNALAITRAAKAKFRRRTGIFAKVGCINEFEIRYHDPKTAPYIRSVLAIGEMPPAGRRVVRAFDSKRKPFGANYTLVLA